jgi:hypothetical protein
VVFLKIVCSPTKPSFFETPSPHPFPPLSLYKKAPKTGFTKLSFMFCLSNVFRENRDIGYAQVSEIPTKEAGLKSLNDSIIQKHTKKGRSKGNFSLHRGNDFRVHPSRTKTGIYGRKQKQAVMLVSMAEQVEDWRKTDCAGAKCIHRRGLCIIQGEKRDRYLDHQGIKPGK